MKKILERVVKSLDAPLTTDLWLNPKTGELKHFENGEWKLVSGGSSSGGGSSEGDSSSSVQIVELNFSDSIPKTGMMSLADVAKLDSDNCYLIINGKYFYKSFESDNGIDYNEFKLTNILGGVRTIYFTVNKSTGAYTINYTYPVQANLEASGTLPTLENIKVGNTTYAIPSGSTGSVMFVNGTNNDTEFIPDNGEPTWAEAAEAFRNGRDIMLIVGLDGLPSGAKVYTRISQLYPGTDNSSAFLGYHLEEYLCRWEDPDFEQTPT